MIAGAVELAGVDLVAGVDQLLEDLACGLGDQRGGAARDPADAGDRAVTRPAGGELLGLRRAAARRRAKDVALGDSGGRRARRPSSAGSQPGRRGRSLEIAAAGPAGRRRAAPEGPGVAGVDLVELELPASRSRDRDGRPGGGELRRKVPGVAGVELVELVELELRRRAAPEGSGRRWRRTVELELRDVRPEASVAGVAIAGVAPGVAAVAAIAAAASCWACGAGGARCSYAGRIGDELPTLPRVTGAGHRRDGAWGVYASGAVAGSSTKW